MFITFTTLSIILYLISTYNDEEDYPKAHTKHLAFFNYSEHTFCSKIAEQQRSRIHIFQNSTTAHTCNLLTDICASAICAIPCGKNIVIVFLRIW